jgi:response regulator RpfG family c-di-GMP phosphodiesterase
MDVMTILVLEETESDLVHHQRILETIPNVRLGLFADPAAAQKAYIDAKIDVLVVDNDIADGGIPWLKQVHLLSGRRDVPTILLCANGDKDARRAAYEYGTYNAIEKPIDPASYLCIARNALSMQVMRRNDATNVTNVVEQLKVVQAQIEEREVQTIYALLHAANLVDPALSRRMVKVAGIASKIAFRASGIPNEDARRFGIAARIYDIGMLALPGALRERRMEINGADAKRLLGPHTEKSGEVFAKERTGLIELAAVIARQHHERFDGRGYPDGLERHDISIYAQLVAVAEMFYDMTTTGPFIPAGGKSQPLSEPQALAYIDRQSGTTFDPEVVEGLRLFVESPLGEPVLGKP